MIRSRIPTTEALIAYPQEEIWYTDDAQMAIGGRDAAEHDRVGGDLCRAFVANYVPSAVTAGARAVLDAMRGPRLPGSAEPLFRRILWQWALPCGSRRSAYCSATTAVAFGRRHEPLPCQRTCIRLGSKALLALAVSICSRGAA